MSEQPGMTGKGWFNAIEPSGEAGEVLRIQLVRREETKRAMLDGASGRREPYRPAGTYTTQNMADVAHSFNRVSLDILSKLRKMGHVSLTEAATKLCFETPEVFIETLLNRGLLNYLIFRPTAAGEQGVIVPFSKIEIDLDFET